MGGAVVASAPLVRAAPWRCPRELAPGEVRRVTQRGPLVGYFLACPACSASGSYLDSEVGYVEVRGELVGVLRPPPCRSCGRFLRAAPGVLEALTP